MSNEVLSKSLRGAGLNVAVSILVRIFTFVANGFILRFVARDVLGLINVRLLLLFDTVLFLSREAFRKSCLRKAEDGNWRGTINLVWLSLPIAAACSLVLGYVWIHALEPPRPELADQYSVAVKLYCAGSLIMLLAEPFYIVGQAHLMVEFKSLAELANASLGVAVMLFAVMLRPDHVVLLAGYGSVVCSCVFLALHLVYFSRVMRRGAKKDDDFPFTSLLEFLPDVRNFGVNAHQWSLSLSFFKQGFLKQLLTEGERYMFTWFSLMTLAEQGVYDVISSLGSIPARLVFAKLEESAHLYFSQTVTRGADPAQVRDREADASRHLHVLLKGLVLFGLTAFAFGVSFCHLALHLYGGELLSAGVGPVLLRAHCAYIIFLAVNGITECYAFAAMTGDQVSRYNYAMTAMTAVFLASTWALARLLGPVGFTLANCVNFAMRIANNVAVIRRRHSLCPVCPLQDLLPRKSTLASLVATAAACFASERFVYETTPRGVLTHLAIGAASFGIFAVVAVLKEPLFGSLLRKTLKKE